MSRVGNGMSMIPELIDGIIEWSSSMALVELSCSSERTLVQSIDAEFIDFAIAFLFGKRDCGFEIKWQICVYSIDNIPLISG